MKSKIIGFTCYLSVNENKILFETSCIYLSTYIARTGCVFSLVYLFAPGSLVTVQVLAVLHFFE